MLYRNPSLIYEGNSMCHLDFELYTSTPVQAHITMECV